MRSIIAAIVSMVVMAGFADADEPMTTKILFIGKERDHPPRTHEYMHECGLLAKCLKQTPGVETIVSDGWPRDPATFEGVNAIVLYTAMGGNVLFDARHREEVEKLLARGVGLVAIHWSTGADEGEVGDRQMRFLGGWFGFKFSKFLVRDSKLRQADPDHPIASGWKDFDLHDEYYTSLKFLPGAKPMLRATIDGVDEVVGWIYERPHDGRSFGFVCGHFHECFGDERFRKAIVNAILWTAHRDVPREGAPCALAAEDMKLPPDPREPK